jgi:peroxiredoxin
MTLGQPYKKENWQLIFVYRGLHFPLCKIYLQKIESLKDKFLAKGAEVVAISGDSKDKAMKMVESAKLSIPVGYSLSIK